MEVEDNMTESQRVSRCLYLGNEKIPRNTSYITEPADVFVLKLSVRHAVTNDISKYV